MRVEFQDIGLCVVMIIAPSADTALYIQGVHVCRCDYIGAIRAEDVIHYYSLLQSQRVTNDPSITY